MKKEYYIQGDPARAEEIKAAFEKKGCTLYRLASKCDSEDLIYYSLNGIVRGIKKDNLYLFEAHPGYKELELPVKPNFKVGDWITDGACKVKITDINNTNYWYSKNCILGEIESIDKKYHLWTIQDAKDGDVLATDNGWTCIFQAFDGCVFSSYCFMDSEKWFFAFGSEAHTPDSRINGNIHPATKEQRGQLFAKIKEAGYEWDEEKKELRKIQSHYDIANFKPFDKVLVRDRNDEPWRIAFYGYYNEEAHYSHFVGTCWSKQCIPFNEDTKHLLGTNDPCGEEFINW